MRKVLICVAAIACVALLGTVAKAQCGAFGMECLANGNLDVGTAGGAGLAGTAPPWALVNTVNVPPAVAAQFQGGFADSTGVNGIWYRPFIGNADRGPQDSTLSQSVLAPVSGLYKLTYDYLVETNFNAVSSTGALTNVTAASSDTLDMLSVPRTNIGGGFVNNPARRATLLVNALVGDTLTVSLDALGMTDPLANPQSMVADRFSLRRIPEPGTLILAGLAMVGLLGLRRRS